MENSSLDHGVWVVIPAAGVGSRMQSEIPKQYLQVNCKIILEHTISQFASLPQVAGILVVVSEQDKYWDSLAADIITQYESDSFSVLSTTGGNERSDTALKGLSYLLKVKKVNPQGWVMVHDAARPCVRKIDILKLLSSRSEIDEGGAILATPVRDTLKQANDRINTVLATQSRKSMWQAQTPQLFKLGELYESLDKAIKAGVAITDEASAMEYSNIPVRLIEGSSDNIKITTQSDLNIVGFLLADK